MKRLTLITVCLLLTAAIGYAQNGADKQSDGARDLYNTYTRNDNAPAAGAASNSPRVGRPGARLRIELKRNDRVTWVSPKTVFIAGDKVRFHFAMNFPGYVVIINQGSSGDRSMLFPYEGVSNHIGQTADYTVPQGDAWFEFDNTAGEERLTFIMSKREIHEVVPLLPSTAGAPTVSSTPTPLATPTPTPKPTPTPSTSHNSPVTSSPVSPLPTEEQEILAALNARALDQGRDLNVVVDRNDGYVLASDTALAKPLGFRMVLKHR
jgi:hypothetical protein